MTKEVNSGGFFGTTVKRARGARCIFNNYDKKKLEKTFGKFTCHYPENVIKYDFPIQKLWQDCLNYHSVTQPDIINKVSFADSNSTFQTNNYIPLRLSISHTNLGNTCFLNSVLQILFQVNTVMPFDIMDKPSFTC